MDTDPNPFRYCGEYWDEETGHIYLRARYYDPEHGRFISTDPARSGSNWFAYCKNNPVSRVDPSGLDSYILIDSNTFEDDREESHANDIKKALKELYGTSVHMIYTDDWDSNAFTTWWNHRASSKNDAIVIVSHARYRSLQLSSKNNTGINIDQMSGMTQINLDMLVLLGCDTGSISYENNIASMFTSYLENGRVIAVDGRRHWAPFGNLGLVVHNEKWNRYPTGYRAFYKTSNSIYSESIYPAWWPASSYSQVLSFHENSRHVHNNVSIYDTVSVTRSDSKQAEKIRSKQINNYIKNPTPANTKMFNIGSRPPSAQELAWARKQKKY